jgi:hypothetical protein
LDPQKLQTAETEEYLAKVEARKKPIKDKTGAGQSTSSNMRSHVII